MITKPALSKKQPLSGVRVLVGRARSQAGALSSELRKLGAAVMEIPFIEIRQPRSFKPLDTALKSLRSYDWLILTSVNGVEAMWERVRELGVSPNKGTATLANAIQGLRVAAIGPATRKALEQRGMKVDVVPEEYVAESVVRAMQKRVKGKRVLLVRAKVARDVIPRELREAGADVDVVEAYETVVPESSRRLLKAALNDPHKRPHIVTFTSSSTVRNFVELVGSREAGSVVPPVGGQERPPHTGLDGIRFASIGPVTSSTLRELGLRVDIQAEEFTIPGLVKAITNALI